MVDISNNILLVTLLLLLIPVSGQGRSRRGLWDQLGLVHSRDKETRITSGRNHKRSSEVEVEGVMGFWEKLMNVAIKRSQKKHHMKKSIKIRKRENTPISGKRKQLKNRDNEINRMIKKVFLMKQVKKKDAENTKLEKILLNLMEQRKKIKTALKLEEQKRLNTKKKEDVKQIEIRPGKGKNTKKLTKKKKKRRKKPSKVLSENMGRVSHKAEMLRAHNLMAEKSNVRILARIEEMKMKRLQEAVAKQEKIVREQQAVIGALRKQRRKIKGGSIRMSPVKKLKMKLNLEKKQQMLESLDLVRNAAVLDKTDQAIAEKLKGDNAFELFIGTSSANLKSAAQILKSLGGALSDEELKTFFGTNYVDSDILRTNVPDIDNDQTGIKFDYEYYDYDGEYLDFDEENLDYEDYTDDYFEYDEYVQDYADYDVDEYADYDVEEYDYDIEEYDYDIEENDYDNEIPTDVSYEYEYEYEEDEVPILIDFVPKTQPRKKLHGHFLPLTYGQPEKHHHQNIHQGTYLMNGLRNEHGHVKGNIRRGDTPHLTLSGQLRNTLLQNSDERVRTEVKRLPNGRVSTKVTIGGRFPAPRRTIGQKSERTTQDAYVPSTNSFSNLMAQSISFSSILGNSLP